MRCFDIVTLLKAVRTGRSDAYIVYNTLQVVSVADKIAQSDTEVKVHVELSKLISRYGLADTFGVRLIHKHFDLQSGEVAVFRKLTMDNVGTVYVMGPQPAGAPNFISRNLRISLTRIYGFW
ncbi:hypothetical protein K474DRAFT_1713940 [Panus rudis PR-1116 ss-1]|nr:hypothetical protein K474DRAFT_1713940 [Panus rudis PR-1116 ss-1]